jgi:hypothetical protein
MFRTNPFSVAQGGKNRRRGKNENESEKRELVFKEDGQGKCLASLCTLFFFVQSITDVLGGLEYAQVTKMLGNGRLEATCFDGEKRLAHIRGKMRKKVRTYFIMRGWEGISIDLVLLPKKRSGSTKETSFCCLYESSKTTRPTLSRNTLATRLGISRPTGSYQRPVRFRNCMVFNYPNSYTRWTGSENQRDGHVRARRRGGGRRVRGSGHRRPLEIYSPSLQSPIPLLPFFFTSSFGDATFAGPMFLSCVLHTTV